MKSQLNTVGPWPPLGPWAQRRPQVYPRTSPLYSNGQKPPTIFSNLHPYSEFGILKIPTSTYIEPAYWVLPLTHDTIYVAFMLSYSNYYQIAKSCNKLTLVDQSSCRRSHTRERWQALHSSSCDPALLLSGEQGQAFYLVCSKAFWASAREASHLITSIYNRLSEAPTKPYVVYVHYLFMLLLPQEPEDFGALFGIYVSIINQTLYKSTCTIVCCCIGVPYVGHRSYASIWYQSWVMLVRFFLRLRQSASLHNEAVLNRQCVSDSTPPATAYSWCDCPVSILPSLGSHASAELLEVTALRVLIVLFLVCLG